MAPHKYKNFRFADDENLVQIYCYKERSPYRPSHPLPSSDSNSDSDSSLASTSTSIIETGERQVENVHRSALSGPDHARADYSWCRSRSPQHSSPHLGSSSCVTRMGVRSPIPTFCGTTSCAKAGSLSSRLSPSFAWRPPC